LQDEHANKEPNGTTVLLVVEEETVMIFLNMFCCSVRACGCEIMSSQARESHILVDKFHTFWWIRKYNSPYTSNEGEASPHEARRRRPAA
jgi:hypothetical protein